MPKKTEPTTELGAAIRHVRERVLHLTQAELGAKLNAKGNSLSRWETGAAKPHISMLSALARLAATNVAEERRYYSDWVALLGNPRPDIQGETEAAPSPPVPTAPAQHTVEGDLARTIVDAEPDPDRRWALVQNLRTAAQPSKATAEDTTQDPHPGQTALDR